MAGMTLASIVSGNTVILKPSSDSPTIAAKFFELLEEAGMPEGVVNFCPGAGASFGDAVVAHPKTRYIAFTGSREVGLHINKVAATQAPGQIWIKRTILEMGGKDAIIVDADADIDSAVEGVAASRIRISGTEVLGLLARHRRRARLRQVPRTTQSPRREDSGRRRRRKRRHGRGHQRRLDEDDPRIHRARQERRTPPHRRRARSRRRLLHQAHGLRRHPARSRS